MSQMLPPEPPQAEWSRIAAAAARTRNASLTGRLDEFLAQYANFLQAQLAYLLFQGDQCPIMYCSRDDDWWAWDQTRANSIFQARSPPVLQEVAGRCRAEKCFGEGEGGSPHPKQQFLDKTAAALECQQGMEKIIRESAMLFDGEAAFDLDPFLFQLSNCAIDLRSNSDLVESESANDRQRSGSILWSLHKRGGDRRPDDCAEQLGDAGAENFQHMMHLQARLFAGAPLCKCVLLWNRRGRNGKGICEERDRLLPMHMPNKLCDSFGAPTPPRPFLKDNGFEAEIGRSSAPSSGGLSLREQAATGAKTAAHWLEARMAEWGRVDGDGAHEGEANVESFALALLQCQSREQRMRARVALPPFDASLYNQLFADAATFGDLAEYAYNVSFDACAPVEDALAKPAEAEVPSRRCRCAVCEAASLTALRARRDSGAAVAGERRQEGLSAHMDLLGQAGKARAMKDGFLRPTSVPECPDIPAHGREYCQLSKIGRARESGPGLPSCTRATRVVAFDGLAVGEFDMIAGSTRYSWRRCVRTFRMAKEIFSRLPFKGRLQPDASWESDRPDEILPCLMELRGAFRRGQEILVAQCDDRKKARFWNSTLPLACPTARGFGVRCSPAASPAAAAGATSGAGTSKNRTVASMEKVLQKAHPGSSAPSLHLRTMGGDILESMAVAAEGLHACVLSLVFDGTCVATPSMSDIKGVFHAVADHVWKTRSVRIALKAVGGETIKAFSAKRNRPCDEGAAEAARQRMQVCHLAQEMEKSSAGCLARRRVSADANRAAGCAAVASGAAESGGQLIAQEEQRNIEPGTQWPSMAGRWNEGDAAVSDAAHASA
ncbi:unnamed protein product [Prorocentrum cordatum]|uniref:Uncharacterized protein n=1 Tax=Prorocentrum cordatum TaxID=2364126 RepID=A0ABN9QLB9_9DINO|nr:unnamed protein product [Polarella glacialis]